MRGQHHSGRLVVWCVGYMGWCGSDTPFDFAQGRLCPTPLTLILECRASESRATSTQIPTQNQTRRTEPALSEVEGSVRPTLGFQPTLLHGHSHVGSVGQRAAGGRHRDAVAALGRSPGLRGSATAASATATHAGGEKYQQHDSKPASCDGGARARQAKKFRQTGRCCRPPANPGHVAPAMRLAPESTCGAVVEIVIVAVAPDAPTVTEVGSIAQVIFAVVEDGWQARATVPLKPAA